MISIAVEGGGETIGRVKRDRVKVKRGLKEAAERERWGAWMTRELGRGLQGRDLLALLMLAK